MYTNESPCCTPETNTVLSVDSTPSAVASLPVLAESLSGSQEKAGFPVSALGTPLQARVLPPSHSFVYLSILGTDSRIPVF